MDNNEDRKADCTLIWTIENSSALNVCTPLESPLFTVHSMMTSWTLRLDNTIGSNIRIFIWRCRKREEPKSIEINYELAFLGVDGFPLNEITGTEVFGRGTMIWFPIAESDEVFIRRKSEFLPKDVLTIRYRMWKKIIETSNPVSNFARTRMALDRHCCIWPVSEFNSLQVGQTRTKHLKVMDKETTELTMTLFIHRESEGNEFLCIDIHHEGAMKAQAMACAIAILDVKGAIAYSNKLRLRIEEKPYKYSIIKQKIKELKSNEDILSPNDVLTLRCEFEWSVGPIWSIIENHRLLDSSKQLASIPRLEEMSVEEIKSSVLGIFPFTDVLYKFYLDEILTDVVLQTSTDSFHVHKVVLCCRSEVFSAMLSADTNAKTSLCVNVDEDGDTLRRLLLYIYTNDVQEMQWQSAADLIKAAHKYELLDLKSKCSAILKSNISRKNFCSLLEIADRYHESDLFDKVLNFMSWDLDVLKCEKWKIFKREKSEIALDAMEQIIHSFNILLNKYNI